MDERRNNAGEILNSKDEESMGFTGVQFNEE